MKKSIFILFFALLGVFSAQAYDFEVNGIRYIYHGGKRASVAGIDKTYSGSVVIPSEVFYSKVGFYEVCSVTGIYDYAFSGCTGLTSVTIPESVTYIGWLAFRDCTGLTSVTIPNSVTSIGGAAFSGCTGLTSVTIPESVTRIGDSAFSNCMGLTSVTIGEGVTSIGAGAFYGFGSPLYNSKVFVYLPSSYSGKYEIPSGIQSIAGGAFRDRSGLTSVTIPESVTAIGERAFEGCTGLTSVTIPEGVDTISIGKYAFSGCTSITSPLCNSKVFAYMPQDYSGEYTIPGGIRLIADYAFYECTRLTSVTIPESVATIGVTAFEGCDDLTSVEWNAIACQDFKTSYGLFYSCEKLMDITFGNQVKRIPAYLCSGRNKLTSVTIPERVTSIGSSAFKGCSGLTSVTIPESVTSIGKAAFSGCTNLMSVEWNAVACQNPEIEYIRDLLFNDCYIMSITFGNQVRRIPDYLCYDWSGLTSVTIPNSVTTIGMGAFYGCTGLTSIKLPKSLTTIGKGAFHKCDYLLSVTSLSMTPPDCYYDEEKPVFSVYGTLFVPRGSKMAYQTAQEWYKFTRIEEIEMSYVVTVRVNDASMGRVTGGGDYGLGEQVTIEAIPNAGYRFVKWNDGVTANPRTLKVTEDITLTAIFSQGEPTANEKPEADNLRVYVQDRTIYLSEDRGTVQVYNMAGQRIYNGHATAIPVRQGGVYIVVIGQQRFKVSIR